MKNKYKILRLSLAAVWLLTALASWRYPQNESLALIERTELSGMTGLSALYAGIAIDATMGLLTLINLRTMQKWLWLAQGMVIISYSVIIVIFLPDYALHPFGVLIKNFPMLAILWVLWRDHYSPMYQIPPNLPFTCKENAVGCPATTRDPASGKGRNVL